MLKNASKQINKKYKKIIIAYLNFQIRYKLIMVLTYSNLKLQKQIS